MLGAVPVAVEAVARWVAGVLFLLTESGDISARRERRARIRYTTPAYGSGVAPSWRGRDAVLMSDRALRGGRRQGQPVVGPGNLFADVDHGVDVLLDSRAAFELWKAAISAGGPDNIMLAVVRVSDD